MMGHKKGLRKRQRESVKRALGFDDSLSDGSDDEDFPSLEEFSHGTVFGVCPNCSCELVKYVDGFGCPHGCVFVSFSK